MAKKSIAVRAQMNPIEHIFIPGRGYLHVGPLRDPPEAAQKAVCNPPQDTGDLTLHFLKPPRGGALIAFKWVSAQQAWHRFPTTGRRMAFPADYLAKAGWIYVGPVA